MKIRMSIAAALGATLTFAAPAMAQSETPTAATMPAETVFDGDFLTIGVGGGYGPSYEGSDDYVFFPAPLVQGKLGGISITPRPAGLALDFIDDAKDAKVGLSLGPVGRLRRDRANRIKDPVVRSLGKLDSAIEVGVSAGVTFYDLVTGFDSLTVSSDVTWDVAGAHKGMLITPTVSYFTPLSRGMAINISVSAEHADDDYADYYFTVSPAGSIASGLPAYQAKGGWKSGSAATVLAFDLDGDLTNGGFALFGVGSYSRLFNAARRTPLTSIRGDRDQWVGAAGIAYTF